HLGVPGVRRIVSEDPDEDLKAVEVGVPFTTHCCGNKWERSPHKNAFKVISFGFLLIACTERIVTVPVYRDEYRRILRYSSIQPNFTKASFWLTLGPS